MIGSQSAMTPVRELTPDVLKGIAVVLMIQVHLTENMAAPSFVESVAGRTSLFLGGPPAAPVFMAIMGYFLARPERPASYFWRRGFFLFAGGMLLNVGLNFHLLIEIYSGRMEVNPLRYVFGVDILHLAGLSVIAIGFVRKALKENWYAYFLLGVVISAAGEYLPSLAESNTPVLWYLNAFFWGEYSWSYFPLFPWLAYPLIGFGSRLFCSEETGNKIAKNRMWILTIAGAAVLASGEYGLSVSTDLAAYYHHGLLFAGWTAMFLTAWVAACSFLTTRWGKAPVVRYLSWMGENVTVVFVFQWLLIGNIGTAVYQTVEGRELPIWFAGVLLATVLLTKSWNTLHTKLSR
jgi:uncharacterized membrane protein